MACRVALVLAVLCTAIAAQEPAAPACDARQCLLENCMAPVVVEDDGEGWDDGSGSNVTTVVSKEATAAPTTMHPCASPYEGRVADAQGAEDTAKRDYQQYTCCMPGYESMPVEVLESCSTDACASPDGKGGHDCSADGFIHPLVCDQSYIYKYARKDVAGNIYSPYICCTTKSEKQSSESMVVAASIWTALSGITFIVCSILIMGILRSPKVRAQGYNLYLVFLAIPDALFNLFSFCRNIVNISGGQLSNEVGGTVHALEWFHTAANFWLNALIVYQVHTMLIKAQKFVRTPPPTIRQVLCQVGFIYFFAALWAAWSLVLLLQGSNIFDNTNTPPFLYTIVACIDVWWKKLLPTQGRTRVLSLYFMRVVLVFLLTWVPFLILVDVTYYKTAELWTLALAYYFGEGFRCGFRCGFRGLLTQKLLFTSLLLFSS